MKAGLAVAFLLIASACASLPSHSCRIIGARRAVMATLFFGRAVAGRAELSDAEWERFAREQMTPRFPGGFTVIDGTGRWRDPATGRIAAERTKIVLISADPGRDFAARLKGLAAVYRAAFHQDSVGVVLTEGCAAF